MRRFLLAVLLLAAACDQTRPPTAAERQSRDIGAAMDVVLRQSGQCIEGVRRGPEYQPLSDRYPLGQPTMEMLTDTRRPTAADKPLLLALHRRLADCRVQNLRAMEAVHPAFVSILATSYTEADGDFAKLVRREISWGQFSQLAGERFERFRARYTQTAAQIKSGLDASHDSEMRERQAAGRALAEWSQAQRAALPITTDCVYVGRMLSCTSY